jgi:hypothetical protein
MSEDLKDLKMYLVVHENFPRYMTPTLTAHSTLGAHLAFSGKPDYENWLKNSFRKVVVLATSEQFDEIMNSQDLPFNTYVGHENTCMNGDPSCIVTLAERGNSPEILRSLPLWDGKKE